MGTLAAPNPKQKSTFTLKLEEARDTAPMTVRCHLCDWPGHTGPAAEAREAARDHRRTAHPDRPLIAKTPKKPKPVKVKQTVEDLKILAALNGNGHRPKEKPPMPPRPAQYATIDRDTLERLYVTERLSQIEVGERLGVSQWTVSQALVHHGISARRHGRRRVGERSWIDAGREQVAWELYQAGLSMGQIAGLAYEQWGYASLNSCQRHLARVFAENGRQKRNGQDASRNRYEVATVNRDEALKRLEQAG